MPDIEKLLMAMAKSSATDLHLKSGAPPIFRINKQLRPAELPPLDDEQLDALVLPIMSDKVRTKYETDFNGEFAYSVPGIGRYRITVYRQRGSMTIAIRRVSYDIPKFEDLHMPQAVRMITQAEQGLVLVAGPTGSGKSTTLATLINDINISRRSHILTIEDPIEYLYRDAKSIINQREIGIDVKSFKEGLSYGLRADPDVILIGEMRDFETFEIAMQAAETGHLVFGTIHVSTAAQAVGRILDLFPDTRRTQIRNMLAFNLNAVIVQRLIPGTPGKVRIVPAVELMLATPTIKKLIREGLDSKLSDAIRGDEDSGMQDFTMSLNSLVKQGLTTEKTALQFAPNPEALQMLMRGIVVSGGSGGVLDGRM